MNKIWPAILDLESQNKRFVLVTMIDSDGHAPQNPGAKMVVTIEGLVAGTVGGGKIENHCILKAKDLLSSNKNTPPQKFHWNLQKDIGMSCGGTTEFLFEVFPQWNWEIVIFGSGHVGLALAHTLKNLNAKIRVIDDRSEWLKQLPISNNVFPHKLDLISDLSDQVISELPESAYYVIMTRGHTTDLPIVSKLLQNKSKAPFIGVMGSSVKAKKLKNELTNLDLDADKVLCPIGLDLGNNDPYEIAISVTAQLLSVRDRNLATASETSSNL